MRQFRVTVLVAIHRIAEAVSLVPEHFSSQHPPQGSTLPMPNAKVWIMHNGQAELPAHLGHQKLFAVEKTPVIDEAAGFEELAAKNKECSVWRVDLPSQVAA